MLSNQNCNLYLFSDIGRFYMFDGNLQSFSVSYSYFFAHHYWITDLFNTILGRSELCNNMSFKLFLNMSLSF